MRKKMKALLLQYKLQLALMDPSTLPSIVIDFQKKQLEENAYSIIVLYLVDNVLHQIDEEETTFGVWNKIEDLFMRKSLTNKILLKERLFGFHIGPGKTLEQNLDEFKKITISLASVDDEKIGDDSLIHLKK